MIEASLQSKILFYLFAYAKLGQGYKNEAK
jgi:hypothetical protein